MARIDRRAALGIAAIGALSGCATPAAIAAPPKTAAIGMTFLQSIDPNPDDLCAFIEANWFAMDAIAKAQGLMTSYALETIGEGEADWNVVVRVGYPDPRGYAAIAERFEAIRRAHVVTLINGKGLRDLGWIVRSTTVRPRASG